MKTDRIIPKSKLDVIIGDKNINKNGTYLLTDTALPGDINVIKKGAQKF